MERALDLFQHYQDWERQLDELVLAGAELDELCNWGSKLMGNPITIHDNWFIVLAMSEGLSQIIPPETVAESNKSYIPRRFIDSFRNNPDYLRSRVERGAGLWVSIDQGVTRRCIYANIWNDDECLGRLLILEGTQMLRPIHFLAAECLAQRAALILNKGRISGRWGYHSLDDIVSALLTGKAVESIDTSILLNALQWQRSDRYQCVRLQNQQPDVAAAFRQIIHNELFQLFPSSYIMFFQQQQCVILNQSRAGIPASQIRQHLDNICRNYHLHAGISAAVWGLEELRYAFRQADIALEAAFHQQVHVIPFAACSLDYILRSIQTDLSPGHLVAPELLELLDYDQRMGTAYFLTLRTYLINERDVPRASQALIIHRTTLVYRLKKIQALTGVDLEDSNQRLYLLLSFRLLEQTDGVYPPDN